VYIKTQIDKSEVRYVKVVPRNGYIKILVGYEKECKPLRINQRYASIDLGVDNLAVVSSNVMKPFIVNGRPLKSINQYANKQIAYYQGLLEEKKYTSKRIERVRLKRENKINDYMHKASTYIVNQLVSNEISLLVIGYNQEWKQDTKMGKRCNQNFVGIPFYKFVQMLKYKCALAGIKVEIQEESYTSKCSFLDKEEICRHKSYQGTRIHRGLYRSKDGVILNADLNGSMNILRKYLVSRNVAWESIWRDQVEVSSEPRLYCVSM
jgi:putative transposase